MAQTDSAVLRPGTGHVLVRAVGGPTKPLYSALQTFATDTSVGLIGWTDIGHTSLDDLPTFGQDGGDTEVKGSWQNQSLREIITAAAVDYITIKPLQVDNATLAMYYSGGTFGSANTFDLPDSAGSTEKALLIVFLDGTNPVGFHAERTSVRRDDAIEMANDAFSTFPLRFTLLKATGLPKASWIAPTVGLLAS